MSNTSLIKKVAIETLRKEALAINGLVPHIDDAFVECVEAIFRSNGRLIISGIGKSALVAQKMVATLNSTGTAAIFMHAADAAHGDLGIIRDQDIVMCISKSGETPEVKVLVPLIGNFNNKIIAMVANAESFLALRADYVILTPVNEEADPNNLAPTSSTAAQMAMGDAIAMALLSLKGFTSEHFAKLHPGGSLGRQLYLRVKDVYMKNEKPQVRTGDNVKTAIVEISSKRLGSTVVLNDRGQLAGIITDGDIRRMLESRNEIGDIIVDDIMNKTPKTIDMEALAVDALQEMRNHSISQLIVVNDGLYKGIIHLHDLLKEGIV